METKTVILDNFAAKQQAGLQKKKSEGQAGFLTMMETAADNATDVREGARHGRPGRINQDSETAEKRKKELRRNHSNESSESNAAFYQSGSLSPVDAEVINTPHVDNKLVELHSPVKAQSLLQNFLTKESNSISDIVPLSFENPQKADTLSKASGSSAIRIPNSDYLNKGWDRQKQKSSTSILKSKEFSQSGLQSQLPSQAVRKTLVKQADNEWAADKKVMHSMSEHSSPDKSRELKTVTDRLAQPTSAKTTVYDRQTISLDFQSLNNDQFSREFTKAARKVVDKGLRESTLQEKNTTMKPALSSDPTSAYKDLELPDPLVHQRGGNNTSAIKQNVQTQEQDANISNILANQKSTRGSGMAQRLPGENGQGTDAQLIRAKDGDNDPAVLSASTGRVNQGEQTTNKTGTLHSYYGRTVGKLQQWLIYQSPSTSEGSHSPVHEQVAGKLEQWFSGSRFSVNEDGDHQLTMTLHPEKLGQLKIVVTQNENGIVARLTAETQTAKDLLNNSLHDLKQRLADHGIPVQHIEVQKQPPSADSSRSQSFDQPQQSFQDNEESHEQEQRGQKRLTIVADNDKDKDFTQWLTEGGIEGE